MLNGKSKCFVVLVMTALGDGCDDGSYGPLGWDRRAHLFPFSNTLIRPEHSVWGYGEWHHHTVCVCLCNKDWMVLLWT